LEAEALTDVAYAIPAAFHDAAIALATAIGAADFTVAFATLGAMIATLGTVNETCGKVIAILGAVTLKGAIAAAAGAAGAAGGQGIANATTGVSEKANKYPATSPTATSVAVAGEIDEPIARPVRKSRSMRIEMFLRVVNTPGAASGWCGHDVISAIFVRQKA
jgi:hypothetical protein